MLITYLLASPVLSTVSLSQATNIHELLEPHAEPQPPEVRPSLY